MKTRATVLFISMLALEACAPAAPQNSYGAGFDQGQAARDAALQGSYDSLPQSALPQVNPEEAGAISVSPLPADSPEATAAETARVLAETRAGSALPETQPPVIQEVPGTATPLATGAPDNPGLSQENDFDVVASRETIESDAARIEQNRAQYTVVEPQALPQRPGDGGPNIVAFALATSHPVGTRLYARAGLGGEGRAARNCADYPSPDQAQIDFLSRGGPERDRRGLDPDGDGYACDWDPAPFRRAQQG